MVNIGKLFSSQKSKNDGDAQSSSSISPKGSPAEKNEKKKGGESKKEIVLGSQESTKEAKLKKKNTSADDPESSPGKHKKENYTTKLKKVCAVDQAKEKSPSVSPRESLEAAVRDVDRFSGSHSPINASSLGLNRIKTRSGPLPQENFFSDQLRRFGSPMQDTSSRSSALSASKLSRTEATTFSTVADVLTSSSAKKNAQGTNGSNHGSHLLGSGELSSSSTDRRDPQSRTVMKSTSKNVSFSHWANPDGSPASTPHNHRSRNASSEIHEVAGCQNRRQPQSETKVLRWGLSGPISSSDLHFQDVEGGTSENAKETESPRFQALLRVTGGPWKKKFPNEIKSFSHELDPRGVRPFPFWKPRNFNNLQEILGAIRARFDIAKGEVNSDLKIFAGDLVEILDKNAKDHPDWKESLEDLLLLAKACATMPPSEFWSECEGFVQYLDDRRQELPMGVLKQLHTRMLFILTRCTRLLQFHKEHGFDGEGKALYPEKSPSSVPHNKEKVPSSITEGKQSLTPRFYSEEQLQQLCRERRDMLVSLLPQAEKDMSKGMDSSVRSRISSWKKLPKFDATQKKSCDEKEVSVDTKHESFKESEKHGTSDECPSSTKVLEHQPLKETSNQLPAPPKHRHKISWGYWGDNQNLGDEAYTMICRICEEEVPTCQLEEHLRICTIADRCDPKGASVDERLRRIADTLEKIMELYTPKSSQATGGSPDIDKPCNMSVTEDSEGASPKLSDWSRRGSEDMLDYLPEVEGMDDSKGPMGFSCKTRFGPKSDQPMATSSAGSITPRSPLTTPRTSHIDMLLSEKSNFYEYEDVSQINELVDIARCVAGTNPSKKIASDYLLSCLEDLQDVCQNSKVQALTVDTFGKRIERLLREKYLQVCELAESEEDRIDITGSIVDEDGMMEEDVVRSLRTSPIHSATKDRTSIDDFEILKPISRGAFGRVFLARKRTTGDLFAIKVLRKADMIRKNAVESILAERDILISVRNPFVVRFFYSFTCRENLYLVMEYLNGGDLYSLLRNLGCLEEDMARVYIAEIVLALEYLHSLHIVHRDLKPDNLLIAHDGHLKLTDFGLSKVGLINSTDDLSGPAVSGTMLLNENDHQQPSTDQSNQRERRQKRSAVGTPDYLAPEILLGTGHGQTADWWSVGIILFELLTGIPPFNAEHPQIIFDNILNRKIPWPCVPEEMSYEARDLIDRLLTEDPNQRLGAKGAEEVKRHPFFKDINWDTLQRQKAAFVPSSDGALDTSYFTSRYMWNSAEGNVYTADDFEDISDSGSSSGSSCLINGRDEVADECGGLANFDTTPSVKYSFSNFSFKNLSQLASINYDLLTISGKDSPKAAETNPSFS
eukprot:TRINITY_DN2875_c0_g1_i1.p1 TRINITY_DN2875_c0_g1~~TRINITY_DN2875_c0_g1_i1.p1  ORF type:complete len:1348 (-),score=299.53 TRINITY_DN2875_c0_g1_i1:796-4839(-)